MFFRGPMHSALRLVSPTRKSEPILDRIEKGEIRALVVVEADPFGMAMNQERWTKALETLELLVVLDYLPSRSVGEGSCRFPHPDSCSRHRVPALSTRKAESSFPLPFTKEEVLCLRSAKGRIRREYTWTTSQEGSQGVQQKSWLNWHRRLQGKSKRWRPESYGHGWPPMPPLSRSFRNPFPREKAFVLFRISNPQRISRMLFLEKKIAEGRSRWNFCWWSRLSEPKSSPPIPDSRKDAEKPPCLTMNTRDANRLGLTHEDRVSLQVNGCILEVGLQAVETVAAGVMVLPRHRGIPWQVFKAPRVMVPIEHIKRLP